MIDDISVVTASKVEEAEAYSLTLPPFDNRLHEPGKEQAPKRGSIFTSLSAASSPGEDRADWSVSDGVTIVENGQAICSAGETCSVKVTITNTREGNTMDESSTVAQ